MIIEIGYSYQLDKDGPAYQSWTYFYVKGDDLTKAKAKAKTHWKKFVSEHGWSKKAKVTHIEEIKNASTYTPDFIVVSSDELPAARKRKSTQPKSSTSSRKPSTPRAPRTRTRTSTPKSK
jgi:hypothetical protein